MTPVRPVFVVGCPRSGSTWLSFLLAQHPAVVSYHHAKLFDYLDAMRRWYRNKSRVSYIVGTERSRDVHGDSESSAAESGSYIADVLPEAGHDSLLGDYVGAVLRKIASTAPGTEVVVDKTPENVHHAELILAALPEAQFIHVVRDPRAVFSSQRSASRSWAPWEFPTRALDAARFWRSEVEAARNIASRTDRYFEVRYEDLSERGASTLERLLGQLGLPVDSGFGEHAVKTCEKDRMRRRREFPPGFVRRAPRGGWREELSPGQVRIIEHVAGEFMAEWGYERAAKPFRRHPWRIRASDGVEAFLARLERGARRVTQLAHWAWVGRKLEWPEP